MLMACAVNTGKVGDKPMTLGGKVDGITSDEVAKLNADMARYQQEAFAAILAFYATDDEEARKQADGRVRVAYEKASSAELSRDGLQKIQTEAQASRQQIADWLQRISGPGVR
jgi:hypothetical protein